MKPIPNVLLVLCLFGLATPARSQGYFNFFNFSPLGVNAPVFDAQGNKLSGSNYLAMLYVGPTTSSLQPVLTDPGGTLAIRPFVVLGYIDPVNVKATNVVGGSLVWVQMVAWDARLGTTYEGARSLGLGGYGESTLFQTASGGLTGAGINYAPLLGLQSFALLSQVPEPSTLALFALGLAVIWLPIVRARLRADVESKWILSSGRLYAARFLPLCLRSLRPRAAVSNQGGTRLRGWTGNRKGSRLYWLSPLMSCKIKFTKSVVTARSRASSFFKFDAFTLIELLVVIGIIAILAALLLPTLRAAKTQAQGIQCLSQLKQFSYAWNLYADDHEERMPPNIPIGAEPVISQIGTWVWGWLDPGDNWPDNTNTDYLTDSLLAPYLARSIPVWRCPGDRSTTRFGNVRLPRVRSYSMNNFLNSLVPEPWDPFITFRRRTDMIQPGPAMTFVFIDEREDSIEDGYFVVDMYNAGAPVTAVPRSAHNGGGTLSFVDGHAEHKKWRDARTNPRLNPGSFVAIPYSDHPTNMDMVWLRERTTARK